MSERARLFVAVWPPPDVVGLIAGIERPELAGLRWTTPDQWHVTLRFFGTTDVDAAAEAFHRIEPVATEATLGPAVDRFDQRVLMVPVGGLEELAGAVVAATAEVGEAPDSRPFHGHLTLARVRKKGVDLRPLCQRPLSARWPVHGLTLVASQTGRGGAHYTIVERRNLP